MGLRFVGHGLLLLVFLAGSSLLAGDVYQAPDPEPTPEETLILEYMNRFRADPAGEADRINVPEVHNALRWVKMDWAMFVKEMKALKPAPPLVFNLKLLDAARKHSWYMTHNGLTHVESSGKKGFVAAKFSDRCKLAGYTGGAVGENCFQTASSPYASHYSFVIDFGPGGDGGMQKGRGHRMNMIKNTTREVGPGAVPFEHEFKRGRRSQKRSVLSVTHNFGRSRAKRLVGGVVYRDANGNGFYDIGEGVGGVKIAASGGVQTTTWKSGAYTLELNHNSALVIQAVHEKQSTRKNYLAGKDNLKFDWILPSKE